jgi:hypothetical protein
LKQLIKSTGSTKKKVFSKSFKAASIEINDVMDQAKRFEGAGTDADMQGGTRSQ